MSGSVKALLALDTGADRDAVEAVIPGDGTLELIGVVEGLEAGWEAVGRTPVDALLVACAGDGEHALSLSRG